MANRMTNWNPLREMAAMQSTMDRLFDETLRSLGESSDSMTTAGNWLSLDVYEDADTFRVIADLPGLTPNDIDVTVHENVLTISGEIERETTAEGTNELIRERRYGKFSRSIRLPKSIDVDNVNADYVDGTLTLTLPKTESAKPRQIDIKSSNLISQN